MTTYQIRNKFVLAFVLIILGFAQTTIASDQTEVRGVVQRVFEQLRNHDYNSLYDLLPNTSRSRLSRERFVSALERAQGFYQLDRLEIGSLKVQGNLAVVDTVLYGRVVAPVQAEGKIVAQQYLVREDGHWRVATGDQSTVKKFLASTPGFSKRFKIRQPQVFVKQNGQWIEFKGPRGRRNQA
ncbi:MAG TPA: hypothetical protein VFH91_01625 [Pyrinomonadaceae bacterium]|nr:hypothetical protein [Pyrinomonadaceae bacterium]